MSGVPLWIAFAATSFPGSQTAGFSSSRPQSRRSVPRGFSLLVSSCGGRSFLPVGMKRAVDFLGCPFLYYYAYPSVSFEIPVLSKILFNNSSPLIFSEIPKPGIDTNSSVSVEIRNPRPFS